MKIYAFFVFAILLFSCREKANHSTDGANSLKSVGLKGKIKTITTSHYNHYNIGSGNTQKTLIRETIDKYSEDGYLIESNTTNMAGGSRTHNEVSRRVYKYDNKGNQVECDIYDNEGKITQKTTTVFNDRNKPSVSTTTVLFSGRNSVMRMEYQYDSAANKNFEIKISSDDTSAFTGTTYFKNNEAGKCIECIAKTKRGDVKSRQTYKYDSSGREIEMCDYGNDGNPWMRSVNKYDKNGLLLEYSASYAEGGIIDSKSNKYDSFDSKGNWIKITSINNKGLQSTSERTIKYY